MSNRPSFLPDDGWTPEPQTDGRLGPPGRKPPTAVATAAPRPPRKPYRPGRYGGMTRTQRIARGVLSGLLLFSGAIVPVIQTSLIGTAAGVGLFGLGAAVAYGLARPHRQRRVVALKDRRPRRSARKPFDSDAQSA